MTPSQRCFRHSIRHLHLKPLELMIVYLFVVYLTTLPVAMNGRMIIK
jgi:hypothetical protein